MRVNKQQEQLRLLLGENLRTEISKHVNWAGTEERTALITVRPTTLSELQKTVRAAVSLGLKVRPVGNSFSSGTLYPPEGGVAIYVDQLTRHDGPNIELLPNYENPLESELTVLSSVTVDELFDFQMKNGVELLSNVTNRSATIGGIVTTGTHGTGLHAKSVCDLIVRMRVVDASGDLRTYDVTTDEDTMAAVRCGLGLFGIIYDVTFHVMPLSLVLAEDRWVPASRIFYENGFMAALVHNNVSLELHWCFMNSVTKFKRIQAVLKRRLDETDWDPQNDEVYVRTVNRPPGPATPNQEEWFSERTRPSDKVYKARHWISLKVPATMPMTSHQLVTAWKDSFMGTVIQTVPEATNYFREQEKPFPVWHMEFSFDMSDDCSNVQAAVMELLNLVRQEAAVGRFPVLKMSARFTGASDVFLAPAYAGNAINGGSGNTCHMEMESLPGTAGWHQFAAQVALRWMQIPGARPHWGKQWAFFPAIIDHLKRTCAPELSRFRRVLEATGPDVTRRFFTPELEDLVYGSPHADWLQDPNIVSSWTRSSGETQIITLKPPPQELVLQQRQEGRMYQVVQVQQPVQQVPEVQQAQVQQPEVQLLPQKQQLVPQQQVVVQQQQPQIMQMPKGGQVQLLLTGSQQQQPVELPPSSSFVANPTKKKWWQRKSQQQPQMDQQMPIQQQMQMEQQMQMQQQMPMVQMVPPVAPEPAGIFPVRPSAGYQLQQQMPQQQIEPIEPQQADLYYPPHGHIGRPLDQGQLGLPVATATPGGQPKSSAVFVR